MNDRLLLSGFDRPATPDDLDGIFDAAAEAHLPAMVVFATLRDEDAVVAQLRALGAGSRWQVTRATVDGLKTDDLLVDVRWTTGAGLISTPMGFGPFATMPVTRRAPYVCLGTWPGQHENEHPHRRPPAPGAVDFLDARLPEPLTRDGYDTLWTTSTERTRALLTETNDRAKYDRNVTFRLSASAGLGFDATTTQR